MTTFETKNILPIVDENGDVLSLSFQQYATSETGKVAEGIWNKVFDTPQSGDLAALCETVITELAVNAYLLQVLTRLDTPVVQVDPSKPVERMPLTEAEERASYIKMVDDSIAYVITTKSRFQMGYVEREAAAIAFLAEGNTDPASDWITRFADNIGMSYPDAAALILAQATQLRAALKALDNLRMDKYLIASAATIQQARDIYTRICDERDAIALEIE